MRDAGWSWAGRPAWVRARGTGAEWFGNQRRLRSLIAELENLSLAVTDADPRWNR